MSHAVALRTVNLLLATRRLSGSCALLTGILLFAVGVRAYWVFHHGTLLAGLGYVRIAENLLKEGRYVGLFEGPELICPPFFPVLLAFGSVLLRSLDLAARVIPFVAGIALVPAAFVVARLLYDARVAVVTAVVVALHPLLIGLSNTAESETVYLPLMMVGVYFALRALDARSLKPLMWCGTIFGLAYETRPEALIFPGIVLVAMLLSDLNHGVLGWRTALHCLCLAAPVVVLAAPFTAYLAFNTGGLRLEGKGIMNYTIAERRNAGMTHAEATLGIGPDLSEDGPQLSPNVFIATAHHAPSVGALMSSWVRSARRNKGTLFDLLVSPIFGSILGIALAAIGLFRRPWSRRRARSEIVLLSIVAAHLFLLLGLHVVLLRYILPLITLSWLWVAKGIDEIAQWAVQTAKEAVSPRVSRVRWLDVGVRGALVAALLLLALWGLRWGSPFEDLGPRAALLKDVGTWLDHYRPGPKRVMTTHAEIAYYSKGTLLLLPYAESSDVLRYVHLKRPDFIIVIETDGTVAPYLRQWSDQGIPDQAATLIYRADGFTIYEWQG